MNFKCLLILLFFSVKSFSIRWYVDDASNTADYYTPASAVGSDFNPGTPTQPFATVNFALSVAAAFDTICVDAGVFNQQVIIAKSIYIFGAGSTTTFFDGANKSVSGGSGFTVQKNIEFHLRSLAIQNYNTGIVHVSSAAADSLRTLFDSLNVNNNFSNGLRYGASAKLRKFRLRNSVFSNNDGNTIARAIFVIGHPCDSIFVTNSQFLNNAFVGVDFNVPNLSTATNLFANISNCTVSNTGAPGIALAGFLSGKVEGNILTDNQFCSIEIKTCRGNGTASGPGSFAIRRNIISLTNPSIQRRDVSAIAIINRDANIAGGSGTLTSQGIVLIENEISNFRVQNTSVITPPSEVTLWAASPYNGEVPDTLFDAVGIVIEGSNHQLYRNKFVNCEIGILVQQQPAFTGTTAPISDYFDANRIYPAPTASVITQHNGFFSCKAALKAVNLASTLDASNSYFSFNTIATLTNVVIGLAGAPVAPFPAINPHFANIPTLKPTGIIDFSPWIKNSTDGGAVGYQGDLSYLIVDEKSPNFNNRGYVQEGHDSVSGSPVLTVEISTGLYNERNVVNKSVHYLAVLSPTLNTLSMQGLNDTLYVDAPFELKDSLICNAGLVNTTALSTILLKETCVSNLGNNTSFVNGPLKAERSATGNFTLNLPVGKQVLGNRFIQLSLNQTNNSLTTYEAEYFGNGAPILTINAPISSTWVPQSHWFINDGGAANFTNPQIVLNYDLNDYPLATAHTIAKRVSTPALAWDYIKDITPAFVASSGTVSSSIIQNAKFAQMGNFAIAPIEVCPTASYNLNSVSLCLKDTLKPLNLSSTVLSGTIISYAWNFGDGSAEVAQTGPFTAPFPASNPTAPVYSYSMVGTYTVKLIAVNDFGCKDSLLVPVTVNALPTGTLSSSGTVSLCPADSLLLNATSSNSYTWAGVPSLTVVSTTTLMVKGVGIYFVQLENSSGCRANSDTVIIVPANCTNDIGISKAVLPPEKLDETDFLVTYQIKVKNYGSSPMTNISIIENLIATFPSPTSFTVNSNTIIFGSFTSNGAFNGNSDQNLIALPGNFLAVNDSSLIELKVFVRPSQQTQFNNFVTGVATATGGTVSDTSVVGNNPDANGDGRPDEFAPTPVSLIGDLVIPSGFSPDADNVNDLFEIKGLEAYPDNELQIFNRWGSMVFTKKQYGNDGFWTGAPNVSGLLLPGNKVATGTYYYILKLNANDKPFTGYITIKY
jgi:gliding motility-associated-like protein